LLLVTAERRNQGGANFTRRISIKEVALAELLLNPSNLLVG
jgi:hypothetical protein